MIKAALAYLVGWKAYAAGAFAAVFLLTAYTGAVWHYARKGVADHVQAKIITRIEKQVGTETVRRETVLQKVQVRSAADVAKLDKQATRIAELQQESARASLIHDNDLCLGAAGVLRLSAVR